MSNDAGKMIFVGTVSSDPFQENDNGKPVLFAEVTRKQPFLCKLQETTGLKCWSAEAGRRGLGFGI